MKKIPVIIDTDPGVDDALALVLMLKARKQLDIKLIASVAGNVKISHTTNNVLYLVENFNPNIPVAKGSEGPLAKKFEDASVVHGVGGFGNFNVNNVEKQLDYSDAVEAYVKTLNASKTPITILALGPLTNIAKLVNEHSEVLPKIKKIYTMSGSYNGDGNVTKYAEFNAYCDPEAFGVVLNSGIDICYLPMELGHETKVRKEDFYSVTVTSPSINMIRKMIIGTNETALTNEYFAIYDLHVPTSVIHSNYYHFKKCDVTVCLNKKSEKYGQVTMTPNKMGKYTVAYIKNSDKLGKLIFNEIYKGL